MFYEGRDGGEKKRDRRKGIRKNRKFQVKIEVEVDIWQGQGSLFSRKIFLL